MKKKGNNAFPLRQTTLKVASSKYILGGGSFTLPYWIDFLLWILQMLLKRSQLCFPRLYAMLKLCSFLLQATQLLLGFGQFILICWNLWFLTCYFSLQHGNLKHEQHFKLKKTQQTNKKPTPKTPNNTFKHNQILLFMIRKRKKSHSYCRDYRSYLNEPLILYWCQ